MIKMRVNKNPDAECDECSTIYKNTAEMYDLVIADTQFTLCKKCNDTLFQKTLRANCLYNSRLKSSEDMKRIHRSKSLEGAK